MKYYVVISCMEYVRTKCGPFLNRENAEQAVLKYLDDDDIRTRCNIKIIEENEKK